MPASLPVARTRAQLFDDHVLDAFERVSERWAAELAGVEVIVEDIAPGKGVEPPDVVTLPDPAGSPSLEELSLGRTEPASRKRSARLVVYRRPVEARARDPRDRGDLVYHVVVDLVAELLGLSPDEIDPDPDDD